MPRGAAGPFAYPGCSPFEAASYAEPPQPPCVIREDHFRGWTVIHLWRYLPALAAAAFLVALLLAAHTPPSDVLRYLGYVLWGVMLPGTLVFRSLRRRPFTVLEDLAFGAVTGLVLELAAWAVLMPLGLQSAATAWPLAVVVPFVVVPRLRRHWRPRGYTVPSLGWSWSVAGTVAVTSLYFYQVFLSRFPILPTSETTRQYGDLPYLLSLAGNAKHNFPLTLPQVAGEPLYYHWFTFVHMAMTNMVGHIDLPVVELRLMVPALSALGVLITVVVAQRLTGRAWAGPAAALLVFALGEFTAVYPNNVSSWTFGAPAVRLMSWASVSLTYSQPLLVALIGVVGDALNGRRSADKVADDRRPPLLGRGAFVLTALFSLASSAAKASSLPVTLGGLAFAGLVVLIATRRVPWTIVGLGVIIGAAQLFATAFIFHFESYGLQVIPFGNVQAYWADPQHVRSTTVQAVVVAATLIAFLLNRQLRLLGTLPLLWRRRLRLEPVQVFLLGGALAGPVAYLVVNGFNASYFTIAAVPFGALLSAWGYCESFERAALPNRARAALAAGALALTALLTYAGVLSTLFYLALYVAARWFVSPQAANLIALSVSAVANTAANRRFTFGITGSEGALRHQLQGAVAVAASLSRRTGHGVQSLRRIIGDSTRCQESAAGTSVRPSRRRRSPAVGASPSPDVPSTSWSPCSETAPSNRPQPLPLDETRRGP